MMPETTVPVATEPVKKPLEEQDKKKQTILWVIFAVAVLILIGLSAYWYFSNRPETTEENAGQQEGQNDLNEEEVEINWLEYSDSATGITFEYPEGAIVSGGVSGVNHKEEVCVDTNECFEYSIVYNELTFMIRGVTGIGGEQVSPSAQYKIISGSKTGGLARGVLDSGDDNVFAWEYFLFEKGPLIGVSPIWLRFYIPLVGLSEERISDLVDISDYIACSFYDMPQNETYVSGRYYILDNFAIIRFDSDGTQDILFKTGVYEADETTDVFIACDDFRYLAIATMIGNGPEEYLYIYDTENDSLIEIAGDNHWQKGGEYPVWISDYELVSCSPDGYYKYDVKQLTRTKITRVEYLDLVND